MWIGASPFKLQPHKMVKYTQTTHQLLPTNCLSVSGHFVGLTFKELRHGENQCNATQR